MWPSCLAKITLMACPRSDRRRFPPTLAVMIAAWMSCCKPSGESARGAQSPTNGFLIRDQAGRVLASARKCPSGHTDLRSVPIVYGWTHGPPATDSEWYPQWIDFRNRLDRGEIQAGGESTSENEPDAVIRCNECGFECWAWGQTEVPHMVYWNRRTNDPNDSFASKFAQSFPIPRHPAAKSSFEYHLEMDENGLTDEQILFSLPINGVDSWFSDLREWARRLKAPSPVEFPPLGAMKAKKYHLNVIIEGLRVFVESRPQSATGHIDVTLMVCPEDRRDRQVCVRDLDHH